MFIRINIIHGVMLDPAKIFTGLSEPSQLYPLQDDTWHHPCGTVWHLWECGIMAFASTRISSGSGEMKRCSLPDKRWTKSD